MDLDLYKLVDKYNLNSLEQNILHFILQNIDQIEAMGIRGVAKANYTSTTTVINLSKKLEYSGFLDMYYNFKFLLKNKKHYYLSPDKAYYGINLEEVLGLVDRKVIDYFVNLLIQNREDIIYTCAQGFSMSITDYITRKLLVHGFKCIFSDAYESYDVNPIYAKLLIVVSKSGETEFLIKNCSAAREKGILIISFTGENKNSIANLSHINFRIYDMHTMDDRNKLSNSFYPNTLMLFEYIIDCYLKKIEQ